MSAASSKIDQRKELATKTKQLVVTSEVNLDGNQIKASRNLNFSTSK